MIASEAFSYNCAWAHNRMFQFSLNDSQPVSSSFWDAHATRIYQGNHPPSPINNINDDAARIRGGGPGSRHKRRKRRRSDSSSESVSSEDSYDRRKRRKEKKRRKREKKEKKKQKQKEKHAEHEGDCPPGVDSNREATRVDNRSSDTNHHPLPSATVDATLQKEKEEIEAAKRHKSRSMVPMSREQYETQQNTIREVYDEESGRYRLVRGTGEIIERIVSRSQHASINQQATRGDGNSFARGIYGAVSRRR